MITFLVEVYADDIPWRIATGKETRLQVWHKAVDLPNDAGEPLILSAVRDMTLEWIAERKKHE